MPTYTYVHIIRAKKKCCVRLLLSRSCSLLFYRIIFLFTFHDRYEHQHRTQYCYWYYSPYCIIFTIHTSFRAKNLTQKQLSHNYNSQLSPLPTWALRRSCLTAADLQKLIIHTYRTLLLEATPTVNRAHTAAPLNLRTYNC